MQSKCEMAFQTSPAFEVLLRKAEKEEAEMGALDKVIEKVHSFHTNFIRQRSDTIRHKTKSEGRALSSSDGVVPWELNVVVTRGKTR